MGKKDLWYKKRGSWTGWDWIDGPVLFAARDRGGGGGVSPAIGEAGLLLIRNSGFPSTPR